jgi:Skp family chaperone for outer membrane proteins
MVPSSTVTDVTQYCPLCCLLTVVLLGSLFSFDVSAATRVAAMGFDNLGASVKVTCVAAAALDSFAARVDVELAPSSTTVSTS